MIAVSCPLKYVVLDSSLGVLASLVALKKVGVFAGGLIKNIAIVRHELP